MASPERYRRRKRPLQGVGDLVGKALEAAGLTDQARRFRIYQGWRDAVGPDIGARTEPESFSRGVLVVRAHTASWQNELTFLKADIINKLNSLLGAGVVRDLKVVAGHGSAKRREAPYVAPAPTPADAAEAASCGRAIPDDEVRREFERLMRLDLAAKRR